MTASTLLCVDTYPEKGPPHGQGRGRGKATRRKSSIVIPGGLLQAVKFAALEERTDVSAPLGRLAEQYLTANTGRQR